MPPRPARGATAGPLTSGSGRRPGHAREQRGGLGAEWAEVWAPHCVDAPVDPVECSCSDAVGDGAVGECCVAQLVAGDRPSLPRGERLDGHECTHPGADRPVGAVRVALAVMRRHTSGREGRVLGCGREPMPSRGRDDSEFAPESATTVATSFRAPPLSRCSHR